MTMFNFTVTYKNKTNQSLSNSLFSSKTELEILSTVEALQTFLTQFVLEYKIKDMKFNQF